MNLRWSLGSTFAAVGTVVVYFLLSGVAQDVFFSGVACVAAAAIVVGVRWRRPANARSWYLLAVGQFLFACADTVFDLAYLVSNRAATVPSPADGLYLAGYGALFLGLALMAPRARLQTAGGIDSTIVIVTTLLASWMFLIGPERATGDDFWSGITAAAYPAMDALLVAMLLRLAITHHVRAPAYRVLALGAALLFATDAIYNPQVVNGTYVSGSWVDAGWLLSYVVIGAAALHPSIVDLPTSRAANPRPLSPLRLSIVAAAVAATPVALVLQKLVYGKVGVWSTVVAGSLLALLAVLRIGDLARREASLRARIEGSERHFRALIEHASDLIVVIDLDGTIRYGSPSCEVTLGICPAELIGSSLLDLLHPEDAQFLRADNDELFYARVRHADGGWRILEVAATWSLDDPTSAVA